MHNYCCNNSGNVVFDDFLRINININININNNNNIKNSHTRFFRSGSVLGV